MKSSIRTRIILSLFLPTLLIGSILVFYIIFTMQQMMDELNSFKMMQQIDSYSTEFDMMIQNVESDTKTLATMMKDSLLPSLYTGDSEILDELLHTVISISAISPEYQIFIYSQPQESLLRSDLVIGDTDKDGKPDRLPTLDKSYFTTDPLSPEKNWYFNTIQTDYPGWYGPYTIDKSGRNRTVMTYVMPMSYKGRSIGVVGIDIPVAYLMEHVGHMDYYENGYVVLTDSQQRILVHPNLQFGKTAAEQLGSAYAVIDQNISSSASGSFTYRWVSGSDKVLSYTTLKNGWHLILTSPVSEAFAHNRKLSASISILFFTIVFTILIASFVTGYRIAQPIIRLADDLSAYQAGAELNLERHLHRSDEIGVLSRLIQERAAISASTEAELQHYIENLENMTLNRNQALLKANAELSQKREEIQERQTMLQMQNQQLESLLNERISMERQLIEERKQSDFSRLITFIGEELKTPLNQAESLIQGQLAITEPYINTSKPDPLALMEDVKTIQAANRQFIQTLLLSKDIVDFIKDFTKPSSKDVISDLSIILRTAKNRIAAQPNSMSIQIDIPPLGGLFVRQEADRLIHFFYSLLMHMSLRALTHEESLHLSVLIEHLGSRDLRLIICDCNAAADNPLKGPGLHSTNNAFIGLGMLELLMKEAFRGSLTLFEDDENGRLCEVYFPDFIAVASGES